MSSKKDTGDIKNGLKVLLFYSVFWLCVAMFGLKMHVAVFVLLLSVMVVFLLNKKISNLPDSSPSAQSNKQFLYTINSVQVALILFLLFYANMVQVPAVIPSGIMLIVGLHFLPLGKMFNRKGFYVLGAVMAAFSAPIIYFLHANVPASQACSGLFSAFFLWAAIFYYSKNNQRK